MHKLSYYVLAPQKAQVVEQLGNIKFPGGWDEWVYETFKATILMTTQQIQKAGVAQKEIDRVRVPANHKKPEGDKNIYVCGNRLHDGLYNACKFENWMRKKGKDKTVSFQDFTNRVIRRAVNAVLQDYMSQSLDAEKEALKSNKKDRK